MVSEKLVEALNDQIRMEASASMLYLSMSCWCEAMGLKGSAAFLRRQSDEEKFHMIKIVDYLLEVDQKPIIPGIEKPAQHYNNITELMQQVYEHEKKVTDSIFKLIDLCNKEDDYSTFNFLQWYVSEQREEESLMRDILDKIKLIGDGPQSLYYIDKEMDKINTTISNADTAE